MTSTDGSIEEETGFLREVHEEGVAWFLSSMPEPYPNQHSMEEVRAHAEIVARRENSLVHLEACPGPTDEDDGVWLCVVTDDRPGLLSLLSAAIAAHSLDVLGARVYTRTRPGFPDEAVDLFSVRRLGPTHGPIALADLASIRKTMMSLLRGELPVERLQRHAADTSRPSKRPETAIYFHDVETDLLLVETADHPGLLLEITLTIFRERLSIIRSHITTIGGLAHDEFQLAEIDGSALSEARRDAVIDKVRAAVSSRS
jgi:UTP:GlnB (protein PII) uridylyltransferase